MVSKVRNGRWCFSSSSFPLQQFSDQNPETASGIKLTMAQLYLVQGTDRPTMQPEVPGLSASFVFIRYCNDLLLRSCDESLRRPEVHRGVQAQAGDGMNPTLLCMSVCVGAARSEGSVSSSGFSAGHHVLARGRHRRRHRRLQTGHRALPVGAGSFLCCSCKSYCV